MACETCGAVDHETATHPTDQPPPQEDKVDKLIKQMSDLLDRPALQPQPTITAPAPAPAPAALSEAEIATKFKDLVNDGRADEALKFATEHAVTPRLNAMMIPILTSLAEQNIRTLRTTYGEKFIKREAIFRAKQKEYGLSDMHLSDPKLVDQLWVMTRASDPSYEKEEIDARLRTAREEWERENAATVSKRPPLSLAPTPHNIPPEVKDDYERYVGADLPDKDRNEYRVYVERQLRAYRNLPMGTYIEQLRKADDPESTQSIGVGPFKKRVWTLIGKPSNAPVKR